jgi:excisionase family DNA binding protein
MPSLAEYMTITQAAQQLKKSRQFIHSLIQRGHLPALQIGNMWLIRKADVKNWKPAKPGRPRKTSKLATQRRGKGYELQRNK